MLTVSPDPVKVESQLASGVLECPACGVGRLAPWAWARSRVIGRGQARVRVRPRRSRCRGCRVTHVLLPATALLRRSDVVGVIGRALLAHAAGLGQRPIARLLGVPRSTLRGWLDRLAARAEMIRAHFVRWLVWLAADADAAVGLTGLDRWGFAAAATGGRLLCNTSAPFPAPWTA